jgi:hypothetical protein
MTIENYFLFYGHVLDRIYKIVDIKKCSRSCLMEQDHFLHQPAARFFLVPSDSSQCVLSIERQNGLNEVLLHDQRGKASLCQKQHPQLSPTHDNQGYPYSVYDAHYSNRWQ